MPDPDPFDLNRFAKAQYAKFDAVLDELKRGEKRSHWMWFIFPQMRGLGMSSMANFYGIASLEEAKAYLAHSVLGPRLLDCVRLVNEVEKRSAEQIFGGIDAIKFRSCLTLFHVAAPQEPIFESALQKYYEGKPDPATLKLLNENIS